MSIDPVLETIMCPYCGSGDSRHWADERGFVAVRCQACSLIYCNPRPSLAAINSAVRTGVHGVEAHRLDVRARRTGAKVRYYRRAFRSLFDDLWRRGRPISWLDVGAGYGEVLEAVTALAPAGSHVEGLEPMKPKADVARRRGFTIVEDYLRPEHAKVDVVSVVDVFSHIPSFSGFLADVRRVLLPVGRSSSRRETWRTSSDATSSRANSVCQTTWYSPARDSCSVTSTVPDSRWCASSDGG